MVPQNIISTINNLVTAATAIGAAAVVLFIIVAGWQWLSSGGSDRGVQQAKSSLLNTGFGFAIIVMAQGLGTWLNSIVVR